VPVIVTTVHSGSKVAPIWPWRVPDVRLESAPLRPDGSIAIRPQAISQRLSILDMLPFVRTSCFTIALLATLSGCVHRRVTIRTDPPGALVLLDGKETGYTPMSVDFTYYGTREVTLIKDGYETVTSPLPLLTPWYQVFPLEFVTDNFGPGKIRDRRDFTFRLQPQVLVPSGELLERANSLRSEGLLP